MATPDWLIARVADSQHRLDASLARLDEAAVRSPSALPEWSRAHVLAHLVGNATAMAEMFEGYAEGRDIAQYGGSPQRRDEDIDRLRRCPVIELVAAVRESGARCLAAYRALPDWDGTLRWTSGRWPVTRGPVSRWREIEIHRLDLALDYTVAQWPAAFVAFHLPRELERLTTRAPGVAVPELPPAELLAWLFGRGTPGLPALPPWG